jgi:hypothetical protein
MRVELDSLGTERARLALDRFRRGATLAVGPIALALEDTANLTVRTWSRWSPESLTHQAAEVELREAEAFLIDLLHRWPELRDLLGKRPRTFDLWFDYGMGGVRLGCLGHDGRFQRG